MSILESRRWERLAAFLTLSLESSTLCYSSRAFSPSAFQLGEKVAKPDEGALVFAEQWTIFMNGRGKLMKTLNFSARTAPSSAFGTFSPRKKPRGEKDSRRRESQVVQAR
jgi:hypothetical protein